MARIGSRQPGGDECRRGDNPGNERDHCRADGGLHQVIAPDATWSPEFELRQRAATVWYHSHMQ